MKHLFSFSLFLLSANLFCQTPTPDPVYTQLVEKAFSHLSAGECQPCLDLYSQAFERSKHSALSHLRAALCADQCGALLQRVELILTAVDIDWSICDQIIGDKSDFPEFERISNTDVEQKILEEIRRKATEAGIDFELMNELEKIRYDDQKYRKAMDSVRYVHDVKSPEYQAFIKEWMYQDSINLLKIEAIIRTHGYPGKSLVGSSQASTAWLVIQHAPLDKQERYLPLITAAAEKGECRKSDWAYLVDRINMHKNLPQIYGSQVVSNKETGAWVFHPIEDEANVNLRRAAVGLGPLEEYAEQMGVQWSLPKKD